MKFGSTAGDTPTTPKSKGVKRQKRMMDNTHEHFIFLCPNCGHEYDYKFTDEEIEMAAGMPIEITAAQCKKCNTWVKPVRKN